ncbi:hypothetical protein D3C71_1910460 [compost metagenome]
MRGGRDLAPEVEIEQAEAGVGDVVRQVMAFVVQHHAAEAVLIAAVKRRQVHAHQTTDEHRFLGMNHVFVRFQPLLFDGVTKDETAGNEWIALDRDIARMGFHASGVDTAL